MEALRGACSPSSIIRRPLSQCSPSFRVASKCYAKGGHSIIQMCIRDRQYTDAPYFRYLHAGEIAAFVALAAFIVKTYFGNILTGSSIWVRAFLRTATATLGGVLFYIFYYSKFSSLLLGKVSGIAQPEDTPLAVSYTHLDVYKRQLMDSLPIKFSSFVHVFS